MKKVCLDKTKMHTCTSIYMKDTEVILAGATVNAMPVKHKNSEYERFAKEYDIHFIFEDNVPVVDFYTVPMMEIFATDSIGGYIASLGQVTDLQGDVPICYIASNRKCYLAAKNGREWLNNLAWWKQELTPLKEVEMFESAEAAREKYEFLDIDDLKIDEK